MIEKLKQWLADRSDNYSRSTRVGGCETCGYGGTERVYINGEALMAEIDAFAATFQPGGENDPKRK